MKKWLIIFGLLISFNEVFAQPCIKFSNYVNGTWQIYKPGDKIALIFKNSGHEQRFKIFSVCDSGFQSTDNHFILFKEIEAFCYASASHQFLCDYILINFIGLPFSLADQTTPVYVANIALRISISVLGIGLGTYVLYKLQIQNGFRRVYKLDQGKFAMKYFSDIKLSETN